MGAPRLQEPGSAHDLIARLVKAADADLIQAALSVSRGTISRWSDESEENGRRMAVTTLVLVCRLFPDASLVAARYFATLAGVELRELGREGESLARAMAEVSRTVGELGAHVLRAQDPEGPGGRRVTQDERRAILQGLDEASAMIATARSALMQEAAR